MSKRRRIGLMALALSIVAVSVTRVTLIGTQVRLVDVLTIYGAGMLGGVALVFLLGRRGASGSAGRGKTPPV